MIDGYKNRYDPARNEESHLFRPGHVMQSSEMNEIQSRSADRVKQIADVLFKDGDVIRDGVLVVDPDTGAARAASGAVYVRGAVRGVAPGVFTVPIAGTVAVGVYLKESVLTELEDPSLRNQAEGTRGYQEPGAARLVINLTWGFQGDSQTGEFFPVYSVVDGVVLSKEAPPNIDAISNAIANYDRQSTGGSYVVEGLSVRQLPDASGNQVYSVQEGSARVFGRAVTFPASRRVAYGAVADLAHIDSEPHLSTTLASQRISTDRGPIAAIAQVRITKETSAPINHGTFVGAQDTLPDSAVLEIVSVVQGATTYIQGTDYKLTAGKVDWSLTGDEPALGSQYTVVYRHISTVSPVDPDETGFTVSGAVVGTLVQVSYSWKRPRYDRLCLSPEAEFHWVTGIAANDTPVVPSVPSGLMLLATVHQTWTASRMTRNDGVRAIPMQDIETIRGNVSDLYDLMAEQRLMLDANSRDPAAKRGLFVDSFRNNNQRDAGIEQTAVIDGGELTLPITTAIQVPPASLSGPLVLAHSHAVRIGQLGRTGSMKVNPYMAFDPLPAPVVLTPAVDHHLQVDTTWAASVWGSSWRTETVSRNETARNLRPISVHFAISGFGPGESLNAVEFDGINVTSTVQGA